MGLGGVKPIDHRHSNTDTACSEAERLVATANITPKTTYSNSVLPNTASNDIQQHVNSANSDDFDIRNLTHSDSDSCAPEGMVPDAWVFRKKVPMAI